jgi:hypothetical protein
MDKLDENIFKALTNFLIISGISISFGKSMPKTFSLKNFL